MKTGDGKPSVSSNLTVSANLKDDMDKTKAMIEVGDQVLVVGGPAQNLGKTATVVEAVNWRGFGDAYRLDRFQKELGLDLYYAKKELVVVRARK